jgi:hypothetical protein
MLRFSNFNSSDEKGPLWVECGQSPQIGASSYRQHARLAEQPLSANRGLWHEDSSVHLPRNSLWKLKDAMQARFKQLGLVAIAATTIVVGTRFTGIALGQRNAEAPVSAAAWVPTPIPRRAATLPQTGHVEELPLIDQVDMLMKTRDPAKAFAAYVLLSNCVQFNREHNRMIFDLDEIRQKRNNFPYRGMTENEKQHDAKLCSGMTERMRLSRIEYLEIAAAAGISGAIVQMANEGPFGDPSALISRPDDPLVKEWRTRVLDQLTKKAENGDLLTLNILWVWELKGDALIAADPGLAYRYAAAIGLIDREINGSKSGIAEMFAPDGPFMLSIDGLSADQRNAQLIAAQHIAAIARERRRQATGNVSALN